MQQQTTWDVKANDGREGSVRKALKIESTKRRKYKYHWASHYLVLTDVNGGRTFIQLQDCHVCKALVQQK
jgi:hypothetical protein